MKKLALFLAAAAFPLALPAQPISGVAALLHQLNPHDTDTQKNVQTFADGPRLISSDGGIWFLEANADRIAFFKDDVIKEWPIRSRTYPKPFNTIGASPADFELDGTTIWFMENGTSGIELQQSVFARLDTVTNVMTEWILPISKPAGFVREQDGTVWVAMSQGSLLRFNLNTLEAQSSRSSTSLAYSGLIQGADEMLYLTDFGSNTIVKVDPQSLVATSWQLLDPNLARLDITQPTFDADGNLYVAEDRSGGAIGRLNLTTGVYDRFGGGFLLSPSHFLLGGRYIYGVETDPAGGDGRVIILDTQTVAFPIVQTTPKTETMITLPNAKVTVRTFTVAPQTFTTKDLPSDGAVVAGTPAPGITRFSLPHGTNFPTTTSYSITVIDGKVVTGIRGALAQFTLLPSGNDTDLVVPFALNTADGAVRTELTVYNAKAQTGPLNATLYSSPVPPPPTKAFTLTAQTTTIANALGAGNIDAGNAVGSLRLVPNGNDAGNYQISSRSYARRPDGGTYGFSIPAALASSGIAPGVSRGLFLASQDSESSIFGIYSPSGATGNVVLHGASGGVRGSYAFFLPSNNRQEFNPAWSAFGVAAESGDYLTFDLTSGTLFPYSVGYQGSGDVAVALASNAATDFVFPRVGARSNSDGTAELSQLLFVNPDPTNAVTVEARFFPADFSSPPRLETLTLPPGALDRSISFNLPGIGSSPPAALGAAVVHATGPVWALARLAHHTTTGDFAGDAPPVVAGGKERFLVSSDVRLQNDLFLFNSGATGQVFLRSFDSSGKPAAVFGLTMVSETSADFADVASFLNLQGGGRLEVEGAAGTSVAGWLASTEKKTGDIDVQAPLPASP